SRQLRYPTQSASVDAYGGLDRHREDAASERPTDAGSEYTRQQKGPILRDRPPDFLRFLNGASSTRCVLPQLTTYHCCATRFASCGRRLRAFVRIRACCLPAR